MLPDQTPEPPTDMVMSPLYDVIWYINLLIVGAVLIWSVMEAIKTKRSLPVLFMLGAAIACLLECIFDVMVLVWWAEKGDHAPLYRFLNVSVPTWMLAAYTWYIGGQGYLVYKKFKTGMRVRDLWVFYFMGWIANMALEIPALQIGNIYTYYGDQPLKFFEFPLWMAMTNSLMPIVLGAFVYMLDDVLRGPRTVLVLAVAPMAVGGAEIAAGWPIWLALNSGLGTVATNIAAALVFGLSLTVVYLVSLKLCTAPQTKSVPSGAGAALHAS